MTSIVYHDDAARFISAKLRSNPGNQDSVVDIVQMVRLQHTWLTIYRVTSDTIKQTRLAAFRFDGRSVFDMIAENHQLTSDKSDVQPKSERGMP